jgi:pre-mRNA-processing factor 39
MFREFVKDHSPKEMLADIDFLALRKEILLALAAGGGKNDKKEAADGDEEIPGESDGGVKAEEENLAMKEKIIHDRRKIFKETESKSQGRWKFEENIKRPYFHIKPLERGQLKNWNEYIEFEQKHEDPKTVEILFERCLISCALYEEFWLKYTDWMNERIVKADNELEKAKLVEKCRDIFRRACTHHLSNKIDIHLAWAAFEESLRDFDAAIEILEKIEKLHPKLMSIVVRRINAERRRGNLSAVHNLYKDLIVNAKSSAQRADWTIKYTRFLRLQCNDEPAAFKMLEEALLVDEKNPKLYLQLLDVTLHQRPINESKIIEIFDKALQAKSLGDKNRLLFSQRKLEFLEEFGSEISILLAAQAEHTKLSIELKPQIAESEPSMAPPTSGKTNDSSHRQSNGAPVSSSPSTTTTYPASNSMSYSAHHNTQYQQYGARYSGYQSYQYPPNYYSGYNY